MEQYVTLSVRRIAITASTDDIQNFFATKIPGGDPIVNSLVSDTNFVFQNATVTFKGRTKVECNATIERLQDTEHRTLIDGAGTTSTLEFDVKFLGLTELANRCANDEKPYFDVYFVHGLGGHAYNSFRHKAKDHKRSNMWARDILPGSLDRPGKKGRYLTFGYPAPIKDSDEISQNIEDTAIDLLQKILDDRGKHCDRPLFFVCHSLGGLVVCQALLLVLRSNEDDTYRRDFQKAFFSRGQTLIRGIIFFGTPFKGSRSANLGVKLATNLKLPLNKAHIMYLRVEDRDVAALVNNFDRVTEQEDLSLLIFFELKKTKVFLFREHIVGRDSARGRFGKRVKKIGLRLDHHKLVKFAHPDTLYTQDVEPRVKELVHNELDLYEQGKLFAAFREPSVGNPSPLDFTDARRIRMQEGPTSVILEAPAAIVTPGELAKQRGNPAGVPFPDTAWTELDGLSRTTAETWVEDTINDLKFNQDERRIDDTEDASVETCDWILSKSEFQNWNAPLTDSIMFVQGGPGLGKSVLAKFLVQRLKNRDRDKDQKLVASAADQGQEPIVAHFFPRGTEYNDVDNSPKAILLGVLYQIWKADPVPCSKAIRNLFNRFSQTRNLDFYWTLFNDVRGIVTRDLYCIVDGLDECIKESKLPRQSIVDDKMEGFLKRLCDVVHGPCTQEKTSCTKILITTRPTVEVDNATRGRGMVLEIQESDTISAVGRFLDVGVMLLGQRKHLTPPAEDFIKEQITQKSGHVFQTAQTALRRLQNEHYNLENCEVVSRALIRVNSRKSDDAYEEVLEILQSAPPQDRVKAARIIRILFFLQRKISLQELEHALLIDDRGSEPVLKSSYIQSTLDVFIRSYLALLVKIDNENMVSLQHQTIRDYFQNLSVDKWQVYSCAEREGGHLQLALICIRYMIFWCSQSLTQENVDAHESNELFFRNQKGRFISYASQYWTQHTREAGELLNPHMAIVNTLLGFNSHQDHNKYYLPMLSIRRSHGLDASIENKRFVPLLPGSFLAHNDLINVLRAHTHERGKQEKDPIQKLMFWRPRVVNNESIGADFDLNLQDEDGFGMTPLHCACQNGHLETVRLLLDCGASGKVYDDDGNSPFSLAVKGGWEETAELLIEREQCWHDPERRTKAGTLCLACTHGMSEVVRHLVRTGFDMNAKSFGWTPVHRAAYNGHIETLDVLLEAGGLPDSVTNIGNAPLHLAAEKGYLPVIEMLFHYKADMDSAPLNSQSQSPHHKAAWDGHLDVLRYLEARCKHVPPDDDGDLPIHYAAIRGHLAIVNYLSDKSNLTAPNNNKRLPIHYAAANGHLEMVQRLLQLGRAINISVDVKCRDLSVAVADLSETFKLLLKHKLDPFEANEACETPLHFAAGYGSSDIVDIYMGMQDCETGLNMLDARGNSALIWATENKHAQIAERLISKGIDVNLLGSYHASSLKLSLDLEDMTVFRTLLDKGVDVNIADVNGETALHWAAECGNSEACKMLIDRGANVSTERHFDRSTPLHSAASRHNVDTVLRLLNAGADPFKRDIFGACIMDFVTTYQPMLDLLRKYRGNYQPPPREEQINILKQLFRAKLRDLPIVSPTEQAGKLDIRDVLLPFACASWRLEEYDIARTCYEYFMTRPTHSNFGCDDCQREIVEGSLWKCKQCPSTDNCSECYAKRSNGIYSRGCSVDHEYLELNGKEWRRLEKGKVNAKGQTIWEWLAELKEIHLVGDNDALETSSTLHSE